MRPLSTLLRNLTPWPMLPGRAMRGTCLVKLLRSTLSTVCLLTPSLGPSAGQAMQLSSRVAYLSSRVAPVQLRRAAKA